LRLEYFLTTGFLVVFVDSPGFELYITIIMLDIKYIAQNADLVKKAVADKQLTGTIDIDLLLSIYNKYSELLKKVESLRSKRNDLSNGISGSQGTAKEKLLADAKAIKDDLHTLEAALKDYKTKIDEMLLWVPNVPAADVPIGLDASGNVTVKEHGTKPNFNFPPKDHLELGEGLGIIDTKRGAKIAGFRGYFLVGQGMLLEQALLRYALDFMVKKGFTPMSVPVMVENKWMVGTGYFPWGKEDHYKTQDDQALVGTAEVSLTSYYADEILEEKDLPVKLVGQSPCFRREVGSYGKDTRGVFRIHYFNKVEQVVLVPEGEEISRKWHDQMLDYVEELMAELGLAYRVLTMCTGDMGAGQRKKYDLETWFPSQNTYRETHSDSYFLDFQARRLNMRYRNSQGELKYVNTLNNTVVATPRLLAAVLENYQQADGSVVVPKALQAYMGVAIIKNP
jgi:seryl-tRNA synthetase